MKEREKKNYKELLKMNSPKLISLSTFPGLPEGCLELQLMGAVRLLYLNPTVHYTFFTITLTLLKIRL